MKTLRLLFILSLIVIFNSCKPELTDDFTFLEGKWKMETSDSTYLLESWEKLDAQHYSALNYVVSDTGMELSEEIEIDITDSGTYYKPTIEGLVGGVQFSYKFVSQDENKYVFENEDNDVSVIWYKKIDSTRLEAGIQKEKGTDEFVLSFEKVIEE